MSSSASSSLRTSKKHKNLVFGRPLKANNAIPPIVSQCVEYLETPGKNFLELEGLFRQSGNQNLVLDMKARYDRGETPDLSALAPCDPHAVAGLLKLWFRELPEALLTFDMYDMFIAAIAVPDVELKANKIRQVFQFIPKQNLILLKYLVSFLTRVASHSNENKMKAANLAIVFGPNILRPAGGDISVMLEDSNYANELMTFMLEHFTMLFKGLDVSTDNLAADPSSSDDSSELSDSPTSHIPSKASAVKFLNKAARSTAHKASKARKAAIQQAHKIGNRVGGTHEGGNEVEADDLSSSSLSSSGSTPPPPLPPAQPTPPQPHSHAAPPANHPSPHSYATPPTPKESQRPLGSTPASSSTTTTASTSTSPTTRAPGAPVKQPPPPPSKLSSPSPSPSPATPQTFHSTKTSPTLPETHGTESTHHPALNRPSPPPPTKFQSAPTASPQQHHPPHKEAPGLPKDSIHNKSSFTPDSPSTAPKKPPPVIPRNVLAASLASLEDDELQRALLASREDQTQIDSAMELSMKQSEIEEQKALHNIPITVEDASDEVAAAVRGDVSTVMLASPEAKVLFPALKAKGFGIVRTKESDKSREGVMVQDRIIDKAFTAELRENIPTDDFLPQYVIYRTLGDGNCLCHAASLALWRVVDSTHILRNSLQVLAKHPVYQKELSERYASEQILQANGVEIAAAEIERTRMFDTECISDPRHYLGDYHIFLLANVLRRPIIIYSKKSFWGLAGLYLPLLYPPNECIKTPLPILYTYMHFSLVAMTQMKSDTTPSGGTLTSLPLHCAHELLPLRFLSPAELSRVSPQRSTLQQPKSNDSSTSSTTTTSPTPPPQAAVPPQNYEAFVSAYMSLLPTDFSCITSNSEGYAVRRRHEGYVALVDSDDLRLTIETSSVLEEMFYESISAHAALLS
ncbi:Rho GTPase-activating protein 22 [Pelomyxa schiedti]|nr:Rho GTPase-activating protein 22 [Pelomyxa schiedti]